MLYRVKPNGQVDQNDWSESIVEELEQNGTDLDEMDWTHCHAKGVFHDMVLIALRHGIKTGTGIAFNSGLLSALERPALLRHSYAEVAKAYDNPDKETQDERLELIMPGWKEQQQRSEERVAEGVAEGSQDSIRKAEIEAEKIRTAPIHDELAEWWEMLSRDGR